MRNMIKAVSLIFVAHTLAMLSLSFAGNSPNSASKDEHRIAGKWLRPDGGYVLELSDLKQDGTLRVAYFNPRPIRVAPNFARSIVEFAPISTSSSMTTAPICGILLCLPSKYW